jgi:HlyD family secretion protein
MSDPNIQPTTTPSANLPKVKRKKKKSRKGLLFGILGALLLIIIIAVVISSNKEVALEVQVEPVQRRDITQTVLATGKVQSEIQVDISAEVSGEIVSLPFKEGDQVNVGDLLVKIKPDVYYPLLQQQQAGVNVQRSNLQAQEVTLRKFELEFNRIKQLYDKGLATQSELDLAQSNVDQTLAQMNTTKAQINQQQAAVNSVKYDISKTTINSPIAGTVTTLNNEPGEKVLGTISNQGSNIMTISDLSKMECQVEVGETDVAKVKVGDTARIEIDAFPGKDFKGVVYEISNSAQTTAMGTQEEVVNFIVKIRIVNNDVDLRPGMSCTAFIEVEKKFDVLSVPIQSVTIREESDTNVEEGGETETGNENLNIQTTKSKEEKPPEVVFIVDNGLAKKKEVKTGISDDAYIEIKEGINEGEQVVKGSFKAINTDLENDTKVKIEDPNKKKDDPDAG